MKLSFLIFILISIFSYSSSQSPVLDTDQMPLVTGQSYYIVPAVSGRGGGVKLSPTTSNQTCPLDVAQENNEQLNGDRLNFLLAVPNRAGVIRETKDLNIKFTDGTTCGLPAVWRIENVNGQRVVTSRGTVGNPGSGTLSNWFRFEKFEDGYKIVFCPGVCSTCRPACGNVGSTIAKNGRRSLLLSNDPLKVKFIKA
ncbi:miraculin-like, partial [Rutidosis leptorrhynchoides]|uniref:miraculin-like n=1 Tax=Rutidosis leptorrhynchoides TaxID=125765 RepID=UPI003A99C117